MIMNVHSRSFVNVRERLRMIMNVYERSQTFMNVHTSEGSRKSTNLHMNGLLNDQYCINLKIYANKLNENYKQR
jgi:hypothetical protein